ncbi:peptide chain release factor N(5)-glutamine methyltransferase [bacterium]|nr:peptide chain release factor N(5)-glutamine methyltransferase [bacterium]
MDFSIKIVIFSRLRTGGGLFIPEHGDLLIETDGRIWRLIDVLNEAASFLRRNGIESPRLHAERLLAFVLNADRVGLYLQFDRPLSDSERSSMRDLLRRRAAGEPLQYLLGGTEFMSLVYRVNPSVLIPRPETEILVEDAVETLKTAGPVRILDVGTGSGCIAASLARNLPEAAVDAVDSEPNAIETAAENAARLGVGDRIRFIRADAMDGGFHAAAAPPYNALISNPPYVSEEEWERLPVEIRMHEPKRALCDGGDGFGFYPVLARLASELLVPSGTAWAEVGAGQAGRVKAIFEGSGLRNVTEIADLNGIPRVIRANK